ncbi:ketopantoate reductase PanE/ApbA C terminal-domain-containing protein [Phascolomyces articulosus]|uniref:2-dehydropantoate 2-reductase n=1 Tax=Phascolomyces articulosus TaxID=60185 RepID=A0AAD5PKH4_9FUNG|nr:ketopantoate reductase PanE/ApbA C terminal-domain-containing protein [Phascolomyces articulosus]
MRYHILGTGAIGCHFAYDLKARHNVTLILRSQRALEDFRKRQSQIIYRQVSQSESVGKDGFDTMVAGDIPTDPIEAVVVTTKAQHALEAVRSIKPYLTRSSTLILFQNGMGIADELLESLWPSPEERQKAPSIVLGVNRHSIMRTEPFTILHNAGWDKPTDGYFMAPYPNPAIQSSGNNDQVQAVMDGFLGLESLNAKIVEWEDLQISMMRKLVVNASLNAATGLLESSNGGLIASSHGRQLIRQVCEECALVLNELNTTADDLYDMAYGTAYDAAPNTCSTVQDIKAKRLTEIEYINGYIIRLAEERNIPVPTNKFLVTLLHAKEHFIQAS